MKQMKELKANYGVTAPQGLNSNQVNEGLSQHLSYDVIDSSCLRHNQHHQGRMTYPSHHCGVTSTQRIFVDIDQAYEEDVHSHLDEVNKVELELEDEIAVAKIFADLDEAYEEDVDSHLNEPLFLEVIEDFGMFDNLVDDDSEVDDDSIDEPNEVELCWVFGIFDNICAQMLYREIGEREVDDQLFLGDPVDNEMTKHDAIKNYCSNVPIGRPRKNNDVV
uniref:Uncharacterized protein n=1 Tax=Tanacetum cinerariifolium TaxID=118510 RepID=A0A6L2MLE0_TANCI|nr:hypothetical protein [Tanacetum cinerariifolium]